MNTAQELIEPPEACHGSKSAPDQPISIYEIHLDSWRRVPEEENRPLTCSEIGPKLAGHLRRLNFTHVQFHLPNPAVSSDMQNLVDYLRQNDFGVIVDAAEAPLDVERVWPGGETRLEHCAYKYDFAWADRICSYFATDPLNRKLRQSELTSRDHYAFSASYILPLSRRLVTRPRPSLLSLMPGDPWKQFANLRLLLAYTYLLPGKKLLFMGTEFAQQNPWRPETSLDWHLVTDTNFHGQFMNWTAKLNHFYRAEPSLYQTDCHAGGFQWIDTSDAVSSVVSFLRKDAQGNDVMLAVLNFTPVPRQNYRLGVPKGGFWTEVLNSDAIEFGGSGQGNLGGTEAAPFGWNFQSHSLLLTLPPLAAIVLKAPLA